ncbi:MAG: LysR family transcriptional regulator [Clostridiaceae bacterium]|jgi:DNA-binding transcriptional LysR family regulator|nr:LysR family transcriptional regulator [Clostridiaceae bacterium]
MALDKFQVFAHVADSGNLTRTAEALDYTQSAISHIIKNLEDELGIPLIIRNKRGVSLTSYGKHLADEARSIAKHENTFYRRAEALKREEVGSILVGTFTSVSIQWIPYILKIIHNKYPGVSVIQSHNNCRINEDLLESEKIHCGFLTARYHGQFDFIPLWEDEYYVLLPKGHPLCEYESIPYGSLNNQGFILGDEGDDDYDIRALLNRFSYNITHKVNGDLMVIPLVEHGLGISVLPKLVIDCVNADIEKRPFSVPFYRNIGIGVKSIDSISPLTRAFISAAQDFITTHH